jgi:hypothetical protein
MDFGKSEIALGIGVSSQWTGYRTFALQSTSGFGLQAFAGMGDGWNRWVSPTLQMDSINGQ